MRKKHGKNKLWYYFDLIKHIRTVKGVLYGENSFLNRSGWRNSIYLRSVADEEDEAIPWCTYSFIYFIETRLKKDFPVFEFGSGASTKWYAKRCRNVHSIENDKKWYEIEKDSLKCIQNVELDFVADGKEYFDYILKDNTCYDIVVVDCKNDKKYEGKGREYCTKAALQRVTSRGVIIVDDMEQINSDFSFMKQNGWRRLDFYGLAPAVDYYNRSTTIFYRDENCLGI